MSQEKRYEAPDVEVYSFRSTEVVMDCSDCPSYSSGGSGGSSCIVDGVCIGDGVGCPLDGYCFTENTSTNG